MSKRRPLNRERILEECRQENRLNGKWVLKFMSHEDKQEAVEMWRARGLPWHKFTLMGTTVHVPVPNCLDVKAAREVLERTLPARERSRMLANPNPPCQIQYAMELLSPCERNDSLVVACRACDDIKCRDIRTFFKK